MGRAGSRSSASSALTRRVAALARPSAGLDAGTYRSTRAVIDESRPDAQHAAGIAGIDFPTAARRFRERGVPL